MKSRKKRKKVTFEFTSTESPPSFQCSLDGEDYETCSSPLTFKVARGKHELLVRAIDSAHNADPSPAVHDWKVKRKRKKK